MRWVAGLLLIGAAVLKAIELVNEPAIALASPSSRFSLPIQIGVESIVGILRVSGLYWLAVRRLAILLFTDIAEYLPLGSGWSNGRLACVWNGIQRDEH